MPLTTSKNAAPVASDSQAEITDAEWDKMVEWFSAHPKGDPGALSVREYRTWFGNCDYDVVVYYQNAYKEQVKTSSASAPADDATSARLDSIGTTLKTLESFVRTTDRDMRDIRRNVQIVAKEQTKTIHDAGTLQRKMVQYEATLGHFDRKVDTVLRSIDGTYSTRPVPG